MAVSPTPHNSHRGFTAIEILVVMAIVVIVTIMTVPMTTRAVADVRLRGDAQGLASSVALAKMRAASGFTRSRLFVSLDSNSYFLQIWDKDLEAWVTEGGIRETSAGVTFGFGGVDEPPPNTQAVLGQSPECLDTETPPAPIGGTACIIFNSRGIPIDQDGAPIGDNALYLTDGTGVYASTLTATPLIRLWWSPANGSAWVQQ
jgi:prepilin-type N-terminal cleavage/methylation domain-containing protein